MIDQCNALDSDIRDLLGAFGEAAATKSEIRHRKSEIRDQTSAIRNPPSLAILRPHGST
jgi:hypothetical protein